MDWRVSVRGRSAAGLRAPDPESFPLKGSLCAAGSLGVAFSFLVRRVKLEIATDVDTGGGSLSFLIPA